MNTVSKKNILIVLPSLTLGGAEKQALHYAIAIANSEKYNPVVIGMGKDGALIDVLKENKIDYDSFSASPFMNGGRIQKIVFLIRFLFYLRKFKPRTIISFTYWPNVLVGIVWRYSSAKTFFWNQRSVDDSMGMSIWEKLAIRSKPGYLANSRTCAEFISKRHAINSESITIIWNAINTLEKEDSKEVNEVLRFLMVANFYPEKDYSTLLKSFAEYQKNGTNPKAELHIIGSAPGNSPKLAEAKAEAFDLGLSHNVVFHGSVTNPEKIMRQADIGILSTRSEGFSNAIMEYMVYGLPIIATNISPNREALDEKNAEYLFPVGDSEALTALMEKLSLNEDLRNSLGNFNKKLAKEKFNLRDFQHKLYSTIHIDA